MGAPGESYSAADTDQPTAKDQITICIARAIQELSKATAIATQANKLAPSVPVIQELGKINTRLNTMLPEINRLQGL